MLGEGKEGGEDQHEPGPCIEYLGPQDFCHGIVEVLRHTTPFDIIIQGREREREKGQREDEGDEAENEAKERRRRRRNIR